MAAHPSDLHVEEEKTRRRHERLEELLLRAQKNHGTVDHTGLQQLLGPEMPASTFIESIWDQRPWLRQARGQDAQQPVFGGLLTLEDMDEILMRVWVPGSQAELLLFENLHAVGGCRSRNGKKQVSFPKAYATPHMAFAFGASIVINHCDKIWPPANRLCASLGRSFRYAYGNLYFTPHGSQTAPPHTDDRDVFVLQLHGAKHWRVWASPHPCATTRPCHSGEQAGKDERLPPIDPATLGPPLLDATLASGAVLYIPRGCLHVADCTHATTESAECSLHLTIAVPTADICVGAYVREALKTARLRMPQLMRKAVVPVGPLAPARLAVAPAPPVLPHLRAAPAGSVTVHLELCFHANRKLAVAAATATSSVHQGTAGSKVAAAEQTCPAPSMLEAWRAQHRKLWALMHENVSWAEAHTDLSVRMERNRHVQREALARLEDRLAYGRAHSLAEVVALLPETRCLKSVPLRLIQADGDAAGGSGSGSGRCVAQASPPSGGGGVPRYIHVPLALLKPLEAVEAMPLGAEFAVGDLPARHAFLQACTARALIGLEVVTIVPCSTENAHMKARRRESVS